MILFNMYIPVNYSYLHL